MLWKLWGLQRKLDALFDDGWICLGIESGDASHLHAAGDEAEPQPERNSYCPNTLQQQPFILA